MIDDLGDRMKEYEKVTTARKAFKGQPIIARLDGKAFHTFTRGLQRPFDQRLTNLMVDITKHLVDKTNACVGYTQSDEITLAWYVDSFSQAEYPFGGRFQKMESILASMATAFMNKNLTKYLPEKADSMPLFDCRVFTVPNITEAYNAILWRQQDCTKNAISMAAHHLLGHRAILNKSGAEKQEMMFSQCGVNFDEYPWQFKRGTFVRRVREVRLLTQEQLEKIPQQYRPQGPVERSFIDVCDFWLTKIANPVEVLFFGKKPLLKSELDNCQCSL